MTEVSKEIEFQETIKVLFKERKMRGLVVVYDEKPGVFHFSYIDVLPGAVVDLASGVRREMLKKLNEQN